MYSREEAARIRQEFWTAFGKYMQPILSAEGVAINWINYRTGVKHIYFRMHAGKGGSIAIELTHTDAIIRAYYFDLFLQLKSMFEEAVGTDWTWEPDHRTEEGKSISRIHSTIEGVNVMNQSHWPDLISFFKPRLMALDAFWCDVKPGFEE